MGLILSQKNLSFNHHLGHCINNHRQHKYYDDGGCEGMESQNPVHKILICLKLIMTNCRLLAMGTNFS